MGVHMNAIPNNDLLSFRMKLPSEWIGSESLVCHILCDDPVCLTGSLLFKSVRQPVLQPADVLLPAAQLRLLLATPQLQTSNLQRKEKLNKP